MKKIPVVFIILISLSFTGFSQKPSEIYVKPLKTVLMEIEKKYNVKLQYSEGLVKDVHVTYSNWRYRIDTEQTLDNILLPLDMVWERTGENTYNIERFAYHKRPAEEGRLHLEKLLDSYKTQDLWEKRKAELRACFLEQLKLSPMPRKTPLNPVFTPVRKFQGYTAENVAIETIPGYYLCGTLYRPSKGKGPFAAVLCPHGHGADGNEYGRFKPEQQYRCAMLAKMGAVVFSYEMFAYGESQLQVPAADHGTVLAPTMQTWNSIRAVDFLTSLPYVDQTRIGMTGESGGGTQTFLLTAIDNRIAVSVPVVMVSSYFFGGCACESGLPIHSCSDEGTNNAEIAAMASPRPLLIVSDGSDWTAHVPEIEFPYIKKVYALYGKEENTENVHLANDKHDYGFSKRIAMYDFMSRHLGLDINAARDKKTGSINESQVVIEPHDALLVFGKDGKLPAGALNGSDEIRKVLRSLQ